MTGWFAFYVHQHYNFINKYLMGIKLSSSFGLKNGPPTYQCAINKALHEYIDLFMKLFLDDFIVFSTMDMHFNKL